MPRTFDPDAARAELRGRIAANEAELLKVRDRAGALALDVALGNAPQAELDAATAEQTRLQANADALGAALAEVDRREAADVAAAQEEKRTADLAAIERHMKKAQAGGAKAAELVEELAAVVAEAVGEENAAVNLARPHHVRPARAVLGDNLAVLIGARLHKHVPGLAYQREDKGNEAEQRLKAV